MRPQRCRIARGFEPAIKFAATKPDRISRARVRQIAASDGPANCAGVNLRKIRGLLQRQPRLGESHGCAFWSTTSRGKCHPPITAQRNGHGLSACPIFSGRVFLSRVLFFARYRKRSIRRNYQPLRMLVQPCARTRDARCSRARGNASAASVGAGVILTAMSRTIRVLDP